MVRTSQQWKEMFESLSEGRTGSQLWQVPYRILGDLVHYKSGAAFESDDVEQIQNALTAWHQYRKENAA